MANRFKVSRDDSGWIVRGPTGRLVYDDDWRWNSRSTARTVAWEYNHMLNEHEAKLQDVTSRFDQLSNEVMAMQEQGEEVSVGTHAILSQLASEKVSLELALSAIVPACSSCLGLGRSNNTASGDCPVCYGSGKQMIR